MLALLAVGPMAFLWLLSSKLWGSKQFTWGGATQMLFGIKGKRWDLKEISKELYNENWTRPDENEKPAGAFKVENGCYW